MIELDFSEQELPRVAGKLARLLQPGDIIAFQGDLAAGKTTTIRALLGKLGYKGRVSSPTFVIEHRYPLNGKRIKEVIHLDFYRLEEHEVAKFDWSDYLNEPNKIVIIEWPEKAKSLLPKRTKFATITRVNDKVRHLRFPVYFAD